MKIKYLGTADVARIEKGENFSGRLADPLTKDVEFSKANNFLIDTDEAGLSDDAAALLLEDSARFKDVTDLKRIPTSLNEQIFGGMPKSTADEEPAAAETPVVEQGGQSAAPAAAGTATTGGASTPARSTAGRG